MGNLQALLLALVSLVALLRCSPVRANFYKSTVPSWGRQNLNISDGGTDIALMLNKISGSGIQTKKQFLFGSIEMMIKLASGNSAGTVTAYYMSSTGNMHDEIDFEFLGHTAGQPYIIHTNLFAEGVGNREQQFYPWFDPTADFHNYTIHWNPSQIVWFVDGLPIRVFRNYESIGVPYLNQQAMRAYSSIWNAEKWATKGGRVKIDWSTSPFVARYRQLRLRACKWEGQDSITRCASNTKANWWTSPAYSKLNNAQIDQITWLRNNYMIYDYCKDTKRFNGQLPPECSQQPF